MPSHPRFLPVIPSLGRDIAAKWVHQTEQLQPTPTPAPHVPLFQTEEKFHFPTHKGFAISITHNEASVLGTRESSLDYLEPSGFCDGVRFRIRYNLTALRRYYQRKWKSLRLFLEARFGSEYIDESVRTGNSILSYSTINFQYTPEDEFCL